MDKHIIDFQVSIDRLSQMNTASEIIRITFISDGSADTLMKQAERALDRKLSGIPDLIDYGISYWWWIDEAKHG